MGGVEFGMSVMEQLVLDYMVDVMEWVVDYLEYLEAIAYLEEIRQCPEYHEQ